MHSLQAGVPLMSPRVLLRVLIVCPVIVCMPVGLYALAKRTEFSGPSFALVLWVVTIAWALGEIEIRRDEGRSDLGWFHTMLAIALSVHANIMFMGWMSGKWGL